MKKSKRGDLKDSGFLVVNEGTQKKEREKEEGGDKKNHKGA